MREGRLTKEDWAERVFSTNLERKLGSTRELCLFLVVEESVGSGRTCWWSAGSPASSMLGRDESGKPEGLVGRRGEMVLDVLLEDD